MVHISNFLSISARLGAMVPARGRTLNRTTCSNRERETPRPVWRPEPPAPPQAGVREKSPPEILKLWHVKGWPYGLPDFWTWDMLPQYLHKPLDKRNTYWWEVPLEITYARWLEDLPPPVLGCFAVHHSNLRADGYQRESSYGGNRWKVPGKYRDHL